jgi:hypothetical protein
VDTFRSESETLLGRVKRKLPFVAAAGVALGVVAAFIRRRR